MSEIDSNVETLQLSSDSTPFTLSLRISEFPDDSSFNKFIKSCEGMIRKSVEYKEWRRYIVDVLGVDTCAVTGESMSEVTVEVHHHIPSLFIVVKALVNKKLTDEEEFCSFDICRDVMELHFANRVGYVTLLSSMHEKFHNGFLKVPIGYVHGDYRYFLSAYSQYLDEEDLDTINERIAVTESNVEWKREEYPGTEIELRA